MRRFIGKLFYLVSSKRLTGLVLPFLLIVTIIVCLYQARSIFILRSRTSVDQDLPSSTCHKVNIYGLSNQQRCYPLLINFGHNCCQKSQKDNCETGLAFGIEQCVKLNMSIFDSDITFRQRNKNILNRNRGAGYWIWKSYALWHELYVAREGDIIVYSDAGVNFVAHINILLRFMKNQDILMFKQVNHSESAYTKRDAFILMDADIPSFVHSMASVASYIFVRKSTQSFSFISEWLVHAQDSRMLTDDPNVLGKPNYDDFIDHRHDQSILGLMAKKWNLTTYTDPSQWGEKYTRLYPTIFQHHRYKH